jgi:hypothetical protein
VERVGRTTKKRTAGGTAVRAIFDAGVLGSAGGILFLLTVARTGQVTTSAARIAGRLALIGLVAAALSIGFQGGLLTGGPLEVILGPTTWRTGFASLHGNSAVIASQVWRSSRPVCVRFRPLAGW